MKAARPPKRERAWEGERTREPKSVRRPNEGNSAAEALPRRRPARGCDAIQTFYPDWALKRLN